MENCKKCDQPLSRFLITSELGYHIACAPEDIWEEWIKKFEVDQI